MIGEAQATLPGGAPAAPFLARHWQRRPLLVRAAFPPSFARALGRRRLFALAARDDVESRLVLREGARYALEHGPFRASQLRSLPPRDWTLLVQGVNLVDRDADAVLRRFDFVPFARLDDLMVSYAAPGGGVGPHVDSYDVFLLQGLGRRRWRYGAQREQASRKDLPVKILQRFTPSHDDVLGPGDMLYLPPGRAHDGIALDACTTWSIGFRAPSAQELGEAFLDHLRDRLQLRGRYTDPRRPPTSHPGRLDAAMLSRLAAPLARIRWTRRDVERFLGRHLTEPKPQVAFDPPSPRLAPRALAARLRRDGLRLDLRTQLLYHRRTLYINGEAAAAPADGGALLQRLADARALDGTAVRGVGPVTLELLYHWYAHGYLHPGA
jgi:50S ribosomal protein L16 3-hydroxylase